MNPGRLTSFAAAAFLCGSVGIASNSQAELVYGVSAEQSLVSWDSAAPEVLLSGVAVQGLQSNEFIKGIDFRPATGQLFALGSFSRLYTIDVDSGVATQVGGPGPFQTMLSGSAFGFDFNPVIDRIRVVSNTNQNLVLDPNNGTSSPPPMTTPLAFGAGDGNFGVDPNVVHSAYTNNFNGALTTQLYGIDTGLDILVTQNNNGGVLGTVGVLGVNVTEVGGFDISGVTGIAYAALTPIGNNQSFFYSINLATGLATQIGEIDGGTTITAMTVVIPGPGGLAVLALGLFGVAGRRRKA